MEGFIFDLQRHADPTWYSSAGGRTWSCTVGGTTYTVTSSVALTSVTGDPSPERASVYLTAASNPSGATVSMSGNSQVDVGDYRFVYNNTLYKASSTTGGTLVARNVTADSPLTLNASGKELFRVVASDGSYKDYTLDTPGGATVSTNSNGVPIFTVPSGAYTEFLYPAGDAVMVLSGTFRNTGNSSHPVTLGENGPQVNPSGYGGNAYGISYTITPGETETAVIIATYLRGATNPSNRLGNFTIGNFTFSAAPSTASPYIATINATIKDGKTYITTSNVNDTITYNGVTYAISSGTSITLVNENDGSNFYISGWTKGDKVTTSDGVTYIMGGSLLVAQYADSDGKTHTKVGEATSDDEISIADLNISTSTFLREICQTDGTITISKSGDNIKVTSGTNAATLSESDPEYYFVNPFDVSADEYPTENYGKISRTSSTSVSLVGYDPATDGNDKLTSVVVQDGLSVQFNQYLADVEITIENASTTFKSRDSTSDFTFETVTGSGISVDSSAVSLVSGTIHTDNSTQTLAASDSASIYSVSSYSGSDGIDLISSGSNVIVQDIDTGESFNVQTSAGTKNYTLLGGSSLLYELSGSSAKVYDLGIPSGSTGVNATLGALGNGAVVIAPNSSKVLAIGSSLPSVGAVVFDNVTNPSAALASVKVDGSNYTLDTVRGAGSFASNVDSVSLTSGSLSVNKSLVNDTVDIITRNATFRVTDTSAGNFTVSADASNPTVTGATNITLISGSITATAGQNIRLGASGNVLALDSTSKDLTVSLSGSTFSVVSSDTAKFSYNGKSYSVDAGNGMTFSINDTAVTVSGLDTGDVFTYDSTQHSVTPAGFMKNNPQSIWIKESGNYSLSGNSVSVAELDTDSNWGGLILVHDNKITVTPSESVTGVLMNDDYFSNTFGQVSIVSNNHYQLSANSNDRGKLDQISINSGSYRTTLSADKNFLNVSLTSARSTLMVTDASSDTFQVTVNGSTGETGLVGAKAATLINGSLTADSNISGGVNVGGQLVTSSEKVTLMTGGASGDGTIAGLEVGHEFKVGGNEYTFTNAGLRNGVQLLRGSKPAHDATSMALSVVSAAHAEMVDMIGTASVSGVSINGSYPFNGFLVDTFSDTEHPSKLYGEVTGSSLAGFALTTVENGDTWEDGYTINVNDSTISIDAAFKNSNFKGIRSGAEFVLDTDDSVFTITDKSSGGAIIGGTDAITQTAGLVAAAESGLESITVGENTVYKAGGLELDVSVLSGDATLSSLDEDESFFIAGKEYSVKSELGLMTSDQIFINNSVTTTKQATLSEVVDESNWLYVATGKDNILTIPPTDEDVDRWIILDEGKNRRYAQVTKTDGTYSIVKDTNNWTDSGYTTIAVTTNNTLNVEAGNFRGANISVQSSGAQFTVSDTASYSVVDSADGAIIGNARNINQTAGTIALSDNRQSITAGGYTMSGAGDSVNVAVSGTSVSVGGLQTGENFKVNGTTYELLANGRFQRGDNALWNGDTVSTTDGAINVANLTDATKWNGVIQTDEAGNLTIDNGASTVLNSITSAYVVNKSDAASIYGTASKSGTTFTLGTTGRTPASATFNTITFTADAQPVSLSSDLANVSLKAGSNEFMATRATGGYTVNYDGKALSVDTAQVVSLQSGALVFDGASNKSQTIMANGQSVSAATESVNVSYGSEGVIVSGITTANESVNVNTNAYSLVEGDGFTVHILDGTTTVEDLTTGDKFKIDGVTYTYTKAGLAKTATGSDKISYLLKSINPADGKLALSSLQSTSEEIWLGVWQVTDGVVELTTEIESSVILVDDTTNPTKTYGQVERDGSGGYKLSKYSGDVGDSYESPKSITITDNVTATISADYSDKPVKATDATAITVYKDGDSYTIGGTIEKFVPESMTFTPASDDDFTISGTTGRYVMTEAGLTKVIDTSTTMLWTTADVTNYVLPDESSWANMIRLTDDNSLDLTDVSAASGANIIVDSAAETRWATLDYTDGVHDIKYLDESRLIPNIQTADGTATFKVNFATTFTTGNGTYTINEKAYTGSGLEIDATATTSTLNDGTVTLNAGAQAVTSTNDRVAIGTTSGTITATATAGDWDNLGGLSDSDVFTVGDTSYKVYGASTLVQLNSSGNPVKLYIPTLSGGRISYTNITGTNYDDIIALNADNQLDLTEKPAVSSAIVVELRSGEINPTTRIAQFTFDPTANKYTLNSTTGGQPEIMTEILLDTVKILSTDLDTTIKTTGTATFTINDSPFAAQDDLTIITEAGEPILTGGTVSLNGSTVKTRYGTTDEEIEATAGTVNVNVASSAVTISAMDAGDVFSVNSAEYTMTSVGLSNGTQLNCDAAGGSITTADLTAGDWKEIISAPSGILTIDDSTPADAFVANIGTPTAAVKYGTISLADEVYTLTQATTDTALNGIILDNVTVQLPTTCAGTSITAGDATFSVTARSAFTIDSTTHAMTNVTAVTLTEGTFNATNGIPVTVSGRVITTTSGTMTVGIDDAGIFVGDLNTGEEFTVDGTTYKMTGVGLLDTTNNQLRPSTTPIYYLGETFQRIIQADGSSLDLTDETKDALVFDSVTAPTTHMATLTFTGGALNLQTVNGGINSITLGANRTLTLDFEATINAGGTTTVNGATYFKGIDLVIDATADSSTLQSGTITLNATNPSAQATADDNPLTVTNGTIRATASAGKFTNISALNNNDAFTFGKDYVKTSIGLFSTSDKLLNTEVTTAVDVADLTGEKWQATTEADGGKLTINSETPESLVVDITEDKKDCKLYGAITKSGDDFTLTLGEEIPTSVHIDGVKVTLPAECQGSVLSANETEFSVETTKPFTIDATDTVNINNVDSITLTAGTLLATNEIPITVGENVITTTSGSMTVGIDDAGIFVGDLGVDEEFTVDGTTYKMTGVGLLDTTNNRLRASTTPIYYLGETFQRIIAADGSSLDLTDETTDALVFDSVTAPTTHMATLTFDGDALNLQTVNGGINSITLGANRTLTLDFPSTINASGTTTVNGATFAGRGEIVLDATADSATLQSGTITLNATNPTAQATADDNPLTVTNGTIRATASAGKFTNISALNNNDAFTFGKNYVKTAIGLYSPDDKLLNVEVEKEVDVADLTGAKWQATTQATDGELTINSETAESLVVDITDDKKDCKLYGALTKSGDDFTLTLGDEIPASVHVDGVKVTLPAECQGSTLSANETEFSVETSKNFTIDATDEVNISDVDSITLTAGTLLATNEIPITVGENVITTTSGSMTVGIDDSGIFVGNLGVDEEFTVNGTTYKMTGVGLLDTTNNRLRASTTPIYYLGESFQRIIQADGSSLDLTDETTDALVFDSVTAPTTHMATLTFDGENLNLQTVNGGINSITLGANRTLTLDFAATINAGGTTTVNGATFAGRGDIVLDATATSSTLQSGTITLNATNPSAQATADENPLEVTNGAIRATAASGKFTNISALNNNDAFTFGKNYVKTAIGLYSEDDKLLNVEVEKEVDVADLTGEKWQATTEADGGKLVINSETPESLIVDITDDKADCKLYGAITKDGDDFTLTLGDEIPTSVHIDGVKVTLPAECQGSTLSANETEFSVETTKPFTIDATDEVNISDVDAINLTAGTLLATNEIPITVGENVITTTSGTMTVGIDDAGIFVGDLNVDEEFTVDGTTYKMTGVGLLDTTNNRLRASTTPIYYLGETFQRIIQADGSSLNLTDETTDALVFDSVTAPTTHMATLTFDGDALNLQTVNGGINTITLGANRTLTLDFAATINASGTTTVNGATFAGRGDIVLDATADSSTLQSGTITLNATNPSAKATADENPLEVTNGAIRATAADGKFTNISALNNNDAFTFGKNYVKTAIGLYSEDDKLLNTEVTTAVNVSDLTGEKWQATTQATDGALVINSETPESLIVDITDDKKDCKLYGAITKADDEFTLTLGDEIPTSVHIDGVKVTLPAECQGSTLSANETEFSVETTKPFTIDATDEVNISDVDAINLTAGTLAATNYIPITVGENVITTTSGSMTVGIDDSGTFVGDLNTGEEFTVDGTTYKMTGVGLLDTTNNRLRASTTPIYYLGETFQRIIQADGSSLNLTDETTDALVFDSVTAPTTHMATLTFDGENLNLQTVNGGINTITLGANRTLTLDFPATINAGGTTTVNGATYFKGIDLVIDATADSSTLQSGTITLNATNPTAQATADDNPLTITNGAIRATAADGKFTNISALGNNDAFTFGKNYVQTAIGLYSEDDKLLNVEVTTAVNVSDLTGEKWQATTQATDGELTINSETPESLVVDITDDKADCKLYGAITKSGDDFTLTLGEEIPASVHVDGVKVTLPAECQGSTLSANETEFSVETSKAFTIDATDTVNINNVDSITLTAGTLLATNEIPITVGENVITTTSGSMTVGIDDSGTFVGDLNVDEEFTVNGTTYKMTGVGLLDTTNNRLRASTTPIYYLGETFQRIIQADGSSLNLTDETTDALVFDSVTAPTTHMATLTFTGGALNLQTVNGGINSITLGANRTLTLDFEATINASGTTTVNGATYFKGIDLVIDATADSSTLQSGMITLNATNPSAKATADENPLTVTNGAIRATAADGKFTNISALNNNDAFTFGKNYVKTAIGLYSPDDKLLNVEVEKEVDVADLTGAKWQATTEADGGELTINSETPESLVVDITDDKKYCKLYGAITKSGDDFTLTLGDEIPASVHIDGVKVTLPAECQGSVLSANETEFSVETTKPFTIDATDEVNISDVDSITLTAGTLLATNEIPITVGENVITTTAGSLTVGIDDSGTFVGDLNTGEEFTVDGTTYKMTGVGLLDTTNNRLRASTTPIYYLGETFQRIIQADGSSLDITDETTDALVFDSVTAPTTHMATLTFDGDALNLQTVNGGINSITLGANRTLTLDFAATINASGTTTVNGATFAGRGEIVLDATADSATLQSGTITLNATNPSAQATADENPLTFVSGNGIRATASAGKFTNISALNNNDAFTFGKNYVKTAIGLYSEDDKLLNTEVTTAVNVSDLTGEKWQATTQATDGALVINSETPESLIVDITDDKKDCKLYGALTKSGDEFTLTLGDEIPTSVHIDGVKVTLPAECQGSTLSANETEFSVETTKPFTIDATDEVNISDVDSITLTAGTLLATNEIPITVGENVITTTSGSMTVGIDDAGIFVGDLGVDEEFTVDGTTYKMTGVGLLDTTNNQLRASTTPIYYLGETFQRIIQADGSSLNLTDETTDALVFDSVTAPTTHMATLTFTGGALNLQTVNGGINSITLGANRTLTLDFPATINASGTTTVNGATYFKGIDLVIDATADSSTLQSGTITLNATNPSAQATNDDDPLEVTNGTIRATAASGKFNHIEGLNNNDAFTFGKDYVKTSIGLFSTSDKLLNVEVEKEVDVADLTGAKWQATTEADDGKLVINSETPESLIVDITDDKKDCKLYGAITKADDEFTLTLGDEIPTSVHIDGVKVTLPAECQGSTLSANETEFSVETTKPFTIDATDEVNISDVDAINLTAGTLAATNYIPITVGENTITTTGGELTVGVDRQGAFVGGLTLNDTFTIDDENFKLTSVGLLNLTNNRLRASTTDTYHLGEDFDRIIAASGGTLDLTDQTEDAIVCNSVDSPSVRMAYLNVDDRGFILQNEDGGIDTVILGEGETLTVDFPATVNASGTTTVNEVTFDGRGNLIIDADDDLATLRRGTITIRSGESAQATLDDTALAVNAGTIRARAADGHFTDLSAVNNGDSFTFGGQTYTQSAVGLINGSTISEELAGGTVDLSKLDSAKWQNFFALSGGTLDLSGTISDAIILDSATAPTTKLADLTVLDHRINLRGGESSDAIETVNVASGANLNVDFETQVTAPAGNVTVNSVNFNAASDVTLHSDGEGATLYTGSVTLNSSNPSVNFTDDSSALSVANGSITASAFDGVLVAVGRLQARDSFSLDGSTYTQSAVGLINDDLISENLAGTSVEISDLRAADDWSAFIAPDGDTLDLTTTTQSTLVLDNTTDPTIKLATLTVDIPTDADIPANHFTLADNGTAADTIKTVDIAADTNLDVDFITQITAPVGYVAANGQTYLGTTDLLLLSDGETSTLTTGTVTLAAGDSVNTTSAHTVTVHDGDGLSVTASDDSIRLDALNLGDDFSVDGTRYRISEGGLVDTRGKLWKGTADYSDGLTLNALTRESNWTGMVVAKDGALTVDDDTLSDGSSAAIVDDASNPTKVFGTLARDGDYSITSDSLSAINLDGVKAQIDNKLAGIPITLNDTTLAVTPSDKSSYFTADATGTYPTVDDVSAIELSNGTIQLLDGQTVTLADDASDYQIRAGNGTFHVLDETFTLDNLPDDSTVSFGVEDNSVSTVNEMPLASTATIDGTTYTAPEDNAILRFDATDNEWYFHDYDYPEYQVTVDAKGNVLVMPGVRFSKVIASGRTLSDDGSIKFAADISKTPVTVVNQNKSALTVTDADDYTWTENFAQGSTAKFSGDGISADALTNVAGVSFNLQNTQSLTAGDTQVTATENDCEVGVGDKATSLSVDKPAQISAPADISLTLNAGDYSVNEVNFVTNGSTSATTITDGVKFDLAQSDTINYDDMTFSTDGTAAMDNSGGVSVTSGAVVTNTNDKAFTLEGDVLFDERPFYSADASTVTIKPNGFDVGERNVRVLGDDDLYAVSLANDDVTNLDSIGSPDGVTVNGLYDATVQTDKVGSLTTDDKTFSYDKSSVTFGYNDGAIASIDGAKLIVGDFTSNVKVNGDDVQLIGDEQVSVVGTHNGVSKILMDREGTFSVNGKTYTISDDDDYAFRYSGGVVAGVESLENGSLVVNQDESGFTVSDDKITLSGNSEPVSLGIVDSHIESVSGADGTINGLGNATVYGITNATINNKPINVSGSDTLDAIVTDKVTTNLIGLTDGATVNSAPDMRITTAENGTFTFPDKAYTLNDTLDATFDFLTNSQSHVKGFDNYSGSISGGDASGKTLNGDTVNAIGDDLVIYTDGDKITDITGMEDGSEVNGDFGNATLRIPEGNSTINGIGYTLEGDEDGAYVSGNGSIISGVDKDATLAVGKGGVYDVNGKQITLQGGDSVTANYDGAYKIDPSDPPITEKTDAEKVLARGENPVYIPSTAGGSVDVDLSGENDLAVIDSPNVNAKVQTGAGEGDSIVVRHGASADVELSDTGSTLIIPTAGSVTLENYNGDNAAVRTYDYSDIIGAVKSNDIKFGDGEMTLGDAIVTYDAAADRVGETSGNLYNAHGQRQAVGFTHTAGGTLDKSDSNDNWLLKGNYAESSDDTQKSGGSSITGGSGDDTILGGGGDYIDGGTGTNQIYLTDETLRRTSPTGATIVLNGGGSNVVHNFSEGFAGSDDNILIRNLTDATFGYGTDGLVLSGTNGRVTFENLPEDVYAHEVKLTDGTATYNAAVAKENELIEVSNGNNADIFYGNAQGLSFSEYTGAVEMNLNESSGTLDGRAVQLNGINKVTGGAGLTTLIGSTGADTLEAGTGSASIWGNAGHDLLRGNTSADKQGATTFYYEPGDGRDTIENFDFMAGTSDVNADRVMIDDNSGVTDVVVRGSDVVIGINNSADDYLTLANAKGQSFRLNNDLIAKVDDVVAYDGFTNCYVGASNKSTMQVGAGFGDVEIWLSDDKLEYHGTMYDGNFGVLDASAADGRNILAGGENDNLIIGGTGSNSIWGGYTGSNDTLVGGAGQNTFFFGASEGHDVIQGAHDGDLVSLEDIFYDDVIRADITEGGAYLEMADGSTLEIQSTANLDYRLADGTTYTVNRATGEWNQK